MRVGVLSVPKAILLAMPQNERSLLVALGHAANEVNILQKILVAMMRVPSRRPSFIDHMEAGQQLFMLRLLIGKIHEAHLMIRKRCQADPEFMSKYSLRADGPGADELNRMNRHFSKWERLYADIRNNFSFHYYDQDDRIEESFSQLDKSEPWEFYICENRANSYYYAAELIITHACMQSAKPHREKKPLKDGTSNQERDLDLLIEPVLEASRLIADFSEQIMVEMLDRATADGLEVRHRSVPFVKRPSKLPYLCNLRKPMRHGWGRLRRAVCQ